MTWRHPLFVTLLSLGACLEALRSKGTTVVLVLGHMRSGSTLLTHLLGSHRDVLTWGERNARYAGPFDLHRLVAEMRWRHRRPFGAVPVVVDQVNHSRLLADERLLGNPRVRPVIVARQPATAIPSLVHGLGRFYPETTTAELVGHYVERVTTLARYAAEARGRGRPIFAVAYDQLLDHGEVTLEALAGYVGLEPPLTTSYRLQPHTGRRGDPGPHIAAGRIVRTPAHPPVDLGEIDRRRLDSVFRGLAPYLWRSG